MADYWRLLTTDSEKLAAVGDNVSEIHDLYNFELKKADNTPAEPVPAAAVDIAFPPPGLPLVFSRSLKDSIAGRYSLGRLGRGWSDSSTSPFMRTQPRGW